MFAYARRPLWLAFVSCVLVIAIAACGQKGGSGRTRTRVQSSPAAVPTTVAKESTVRPQLVIAGIIAPLQNVAVSTSLSEPTLSVSVNEGDNVRKGQVLAQLDVTDLKANLAAQQALAQSDDAKVAQTRYTAQLSYGQNPDQVTQARAAVRSAQEALSRDRLDLARYKQLASQGYIADQQYTQQLATVRVDEANLRSQEAALNSSVTNLQVNGGPGHGLQAANVESSVADAASARAQIDQIDAQIARATILSPVDGVVVNRNLNPGEYPGSRTSFTIQEISSVYAELNASSADVFRIKAGAPVTLVAGADASGHKYRGKIVAVLGQVAPGSTNFTVKALVANPGNALQSGVPVTGTISLGATTGVGIPSAAFLDDTNSTVYAIKDGKAQTANVKQIATDGNTSIVSGLPEGTTLVSNGQLGITAGQEINPKPRPSGARGVASDAEASPGAEASPSGEASPGEEASPGGQHHHRHASPAP